MENVNIKGFSKNQYNKAGEKLKNNNLSEEEKKDFLKKLNTYKKFHSYPLNVFVNRLNSLKKERSSILISQRLKRTSSIIKKLKRRYKEKATMKLTQIQDIGGCRIIFYTLKELQSFYEKNYLNSSLKHKLIKTNNYLSKPKKDGYRSLHLVYKYKSDKEKKKIYNGLSIEIQFRTKLQHIWATAVEIVDFFTKQNLKLNKGEKKWKDFFKTLSKIFFNEEYKKKNKNEDIKRLNCLEKELGVVEHFQKWRYSFHILNKEYINKKNVEFFY